VEALTTSARIRIADFRDASAIAAVHVAAWHTTYPGVVDQVYIDGLSVVDRTDAWERRLRRESRIVPDILVAEAASGELVGFASGGPIREPEIGFDAELHAIYVLQSAQRHGIGRRLVTAWSEIAIRRGLRAAVVRVLAQNPACAFYERLGARRIRDGILEIDGQPYPEVWYGWTDLRTLTA
jgi:GNAT superfamily N-acetyltransferase